MLALPDTYERNQWLIDLMTAPVGTVEGTFDPAKTLDDLMAQYESRPVEPISEKIEKMESTLMRLPQVECPVTHHFGDGIYIREASFPAGAIVIGHHHKTEHVCIMLKGRMIVADHDGMTKELIAPMTFIAKQGRKTVYIIEDTIFQNVYATTETDIEKLEDMFLSVSENWKATSDSIKTLMVKNNENHLDYQEMLKEFGLTENEARTIAENAHDQIQMPFGSYKYMIGASPIEGLGVFATGNIKAGEVIAPARISGMRTPVGRYTNHAKIPNAQLIVNIDGDVDLVALRRIEGCRGGMAGEEITVDYRKIVYESLKGELICHPRR